MPAITSSHRERRRRRILSSAIEVFAERGFGLASVDVICRGAGLSKGGLYTYFASKEELFVAACGLVFEERFAQLSGAPDPNRSAWDQLQQLMAALADHVDTQSRAFLRLWVESFLQASSIPALLDLKTGVHERFAEMLTVLVQQGQREGELRADIDTQLVVHSVLALVDGILLYSLVPGWTADSQRMLRILPEPFLTGEAGARPVVGS